MEPSDNNFLIRYIPVQIKAMYPMGITADFIHIITLQSSSYSTLNPWLFNLILMFLSKSRNEVVKRKKLERRDYKYRRLMG